MEAGPTQGVWTETLKNGYVMWVNTQLNVVTVTNPVSGNYAKYDFDPEYGIRISDIARIKKSHTREQVFIV